ncbi:MAG: DNA primase [Treponema sp.]|jgi:DNA primase|nr:DNA primase [Treponema sp.]
MARLTEACKQAVLESIDALAVAGDYLRLEKKSGRYWGLCPFHHEKTPSFTVNAERGSYYCFGCHKGGSIISFYMEMEKQSFGEALEAMAKRFGVPVVYESGAPSHEDKRGDEYAELYSRIAGTFYHFLIDKPDGLNAKQYILSRGISLESVTRFQLGYAPRDRSWLYRFLGSKGGFSHSFLAESGLFLPKSPQTAFLGNRLIFPIRDRNGRTVAFGGRLLEGEGPKYLNSPESALFKKGRTLYALDLALPAIRSEKAVYLAEGYLDVIALHQGGICNAVAPLGTAFTDEQAKLLRRWADRLNLLFDNDEAGKKAALKAVLTARKAGLECHIVDIGAYFKGEARIPKDPAEILQNFGAEALQQSVKYTINDLEYVISRGRLLQNTSQQVAFLFPFLDVLDSEVTKDVWVGVIADAFRVERRAVRADYEAAAKTFEAPPAGVAALRSNEELFLMAMLCCHPGFFRRVRSCIALEDIGDSRARELYIVLEEWFRGGNNEHVETWELMRRIDDDVLRDYVMRQEASGVFDKGGQMLEDGIKRVKRNVLERRMEEIVRLLRDPSLEYSRQEDLLAEKLHIDTELKDLFELSAAH